MKRFVEIKRIFDNDLLQDILSVDMIQNIYIDMPEGKTVVIKCTNGHIYREKYDNYGNCSRRFRELRSYLGAGQHTVCHLLDIVEQNNDESGDDIAEQDS